MLPYPYITTEDWLGFIMVQGIEASQYIFNLGWCEIDDVISNTAGAVIGFGLRIAFEKIYRKNRGKNCVY